MSEPEIQLYNAHAEAFYQLGKVLFGAGGFTGYLLKLTDAIPELFYLLPFNLGRASTEGSEGNHYVRHREFYW